MEAVEAFGTAFNRTSLEWKPVDPDVCAMPKAQDDAFNRTSLEWKQIPPLKTRQHVVGKDF